jgi:hypothetical protein
VILLGRYNRIIIIIIIIVFSQSVLTILTVPICTTSYYCNYCSSISSTSTNAYSPPAHSGTMHGEKKEHADWTGLSCSAVPATESNALVGASHKASTWHAVYARLTKLVSRHGRMA